MYISVFRPIQQAKLQSIITYFDWIEKPENINGVVTISRQVKIVGL